MNTKLVLTVLASAGALAVIAFLSAWSLRRSNHPWVGTKKLPSISTAQWAHIERLALPKRIAGIAALVALAATFIVPDSVQQLVVALACVCVGAWFFLREQQKWIAGRFEDVSTGVTFFGKPAKLEAIVGMTLGAVAVIVGIYGIVSELTS